MAFLKIGANEKIQIVKVGEETEVRINTKQGIVVETLQEYEKISDKKEESKEEDKVNEGKKEEVK